MDLALEIHEVVSLVKGAKDAASGFDGLVGHIRTKVGQDHVGPLTQVAIDSDVANVASQLDALVANEPPSSDIDTFWFGLFDALNDAGDETIGYYVAGVSGFDPKDHDTLCDPAWWPEGRYLSSEALSAIKTAELAAEDSEVKMFLCYAGQLGAAILVSRFAIRGVQGDRRVVVGFDSGDLTEVST